MTRACGADDIKNSLYRRLFRKLRFQMIDDSSRLSLETGSPAFIRCTALSLNFDVRSSRFLLPFKGTPPLDVKCPYFPCLSLGCSPFACLNFGVHSTYPKAF